MTEPVGLYIHIPFCASKCGYCDFLSFASGDKEAYTYALINEINEYDNSNEVDTIYIGGGTPTALPPLFLYSIIQSLRRFNVTKDFEFTVEANPGTLSTKMLAMLYYNNVNRLSIGLQAWQDPLLKTIGRIHSCDDFIKNFQTARKVGFNNINVDIMFALPNQSMNDWKETLTRLIDLQPEHISAYSLTPEEGTDMYKRFSELPGEEIDRAMYHLANEMLADAGYVHYELSNYAKPDFESRHNTRYWERRPYYGFGLGAHSFDGNTRWNNTSDMKSYLSKNKARNAPLFSEICEIRFEETNRKVGSTFLAHKKNKLRENFSILTEEESFSEKIILGLRLSKGLDASLLQNHKSITDKLINDGLLTQTDNRIKLTSKGMDLANQVFASYI